MKLKLKHIYKYLIWMTIPVFLWWAFKSVQLENVFHILQNLSTSKILLYVLINIFIAFSLSFRWWYILKGMGQVIEYGKLLILRIAAFSISYLTPGPQFGGEPLQVYGLYKLYGVNYATSTSSVMLDKIFELITNLSVLAVSSLIIMELNFLPQYFNLGLIVTLAIFITMPVALLILYFRNKKPVSSIFKYILKMRGMKLFTYSLISKVEYVESKLQNYIITNPARIIAILGISVSGWILIFFEYWIVMLFLGKSLTLPQLFIIIIIIRISFLLPLPGALGALEAAHVLAMQSLGLDPALGISMCILIRFRDFLLSLIGIRITLKISRSYITITTEN